MNDFYCTNQQLEALGHVKVQYRAITSRDES
jgi:hypothetical protein